MITPEKPSKHTASQRPLAPTENGPDAEIMTDSQEGIVPATQNVAEVIGTLNPWSLSQFRQFFELLDGWDTQRATADGQTVELGGEILVGTDAVSKNLGSADGDFPEAVPANPATRFHPEPKELRPALPASAPADDIDAPQKVIQLDRTVPVTVPTIVEDKKVAA